jgi:ribonuclease VapC
VSDYVLDASAVIAYLQQEPGWSRVESLIQEQRCHLLTVNLAEILSRLSDWNVPVHELKQHIDGLEMILTAFDAELAVAAAELRRPTRPLGLSLGDRACLALARKLDATAVTADRPWLNLDAALDIRVECLRPDTN